MISLRDILSSPLDIFKDITYGLHYPLNIHKILLIWS